MTSFVVVSPDENKRREYIDKFCKNAEIDPFDISLLTSVTTVKKSPSSTNQTNTSQSIGIEDIKNIHKKIFLKPINGKSKAVVIEDAQLLTHVAQNALLKVLEEPPENTFILLSVHSKEALLPTILSRCKIVELEKEKTTLTIDENNNFLEFIKILPSMTVGEKLKKAEELAKDKELALEWIAKLIWALREDLVSNDSSSNLAKIHFNKRTIPSLQSLYTTIKSTNVSPRFAIENTLLHLNS